MGTYIIAATWEEETRLVIEAEDEDAAMALAESLDLSQLVGISEPPANVTVKPYGCACGVDYDFHDPDPEEPTCDTA